MGKRVMIYDASEEDFILSASWYWGARFYMRRGKATKTRDDDVDEYKGVRSFEEMLRYLRDLEDEIDSLQFWGHGWFGAFLINEEPIRFPWGNRSPYRVLTRKLAEEQFHSQSLIWFRTCATFATEQGHHFATKWADFFNCTIAGHTHIIGPWQSGLHTIGPDEEPSWDVREGVKGRGSKKKAIGSLPWLTHTIRCTEGVIPTGW